MDPSNRSICFFSISFISCLRSYANQTMHVRYDCNQRVHRAQFKFVEFQQNKLPVGIKFSFD